MTYLKIFLLSFILISPTVHAASTCHYTYTVWNTNLKGNSKTQTVRKSKDQLNPNEQGPWGCTVCEEDQITLKLQNGMELKLCKNIAKKTETSLNQLIDSGVTINSLKGYRPSISRGPVDAKGNRTLFSNHAYGTAIDINQKHNGLYYNCKTWSKNCSLRMGGHYKPLKSKLSFTSTHPMVIQMKKTGYQWGGEIQGQMKDFMHFSPDGK